MIPDWINEAYILVYASALLNFAEDMVQIFLYCSLCACASSYIFINKKMVHMFLKNI